MGREEEIREILDHLQGRGVFIFGVRGMGGIGKTVLAYVVAERLKGQFNAQFEIDLKGSESVAITPGEAQALVLHGFDPQAKLPDDPAERTVLYRSVLAQRPALLLMDNARDAEQVKPLVPPDGCILLVTSRRRFELPGWFAKDLETLPPDKARELLTSIAPRVAARDAADRRRLDEIVKLCGYPPLAVRLAGGALAGRKDLTPQAYIDRLADERNRLTHLDEARAAILASVALLDDEPRRLWRLLGVFPGEFAAAAAAAVWQLEEDAADRAIGTLMTFSLLDWSGESQRYRLHDLVRLAAREQLDADASSRDAAMQRFAAHFEKVLASSQRSYLAGGDKLLAGLKLYDAERHNAAAAINWCMEQSATDDDAARLLSALLDASAYCAGLREHPGLIIAWRKAALAAARRLKDRAAEGVHLGTLGLRYANVGEPRRAIETYEQVLTIMREIGNREGEGTVLGSLSSEYLKLGEPCRAIETYEQQLKIAREIDDRRGEAETSWSLGLAFEQQGDIARAVELMQVLVDYLREIGHPNAEKCAAYVDALRRRLK